MFKIRQSVIVCATMSAVWAAAGTSWAKDKDEPNKPHKPHQPAGASPVQPNPGRTQPPGHQGGGQPGGQSLPQFKVNPGDGRPPVVPNNPVQQAPPKVHVPQGNPGAGNQPGTQPKIIVPQGQPRLQLPQGNPKVDQPSNIVPGAGNQPGTQPKVITPQGQPRLQVPQGNPKIDQPANTIPGVGNQPGVQPKIVVPHGHRDQPGDRPKVDAPHQDPSKLPPFSTNVPGTLNPKIDHRVDPKVNLEHRGNAGGLRNPSQQGNPGVGNDPKVGNFTPNVGRERLPMRVDNPIAGVQKHTVPLNIPKNGNTRPLNVRDTVPGKNPDQLQSLLQARDHRELRQNFDHLKHSPEFEKNPQLAHMNLDRISGFHQDRLQHGEGFQHWRQTNVGHQLNLDRQFQLQRHGDLTRQMNLSVNIINAGGWQHRQHGAVAAAFTAGSTSVWYAGGGCYPTHCWYPKWSPWVSWCWWDTCTPFYDPRPYYCRPVVYQPCQPWVYYQYPVWQPLPVVTCGTWVDVAPVVIPVGQDLQLLAVRFVDNGHAEQNLGPRYRVWVRNNSQIQITAPFSVLAIADNDQVPNAESPQFGVVIPSMDIGEIKPVDIRLPLAANRLGVTPEGYRVPFNYLHVLVDSHQQIPETDEANNGSVVARTDILPVDPAAFSTDQTAAAPGGTLTVAGEGFGPEPGRVLVSVNGQQTEAMIQGWYDLGIRFTVPSYTLTGAVEADILVVRGDGAASNPLDIQLAPQSLLGQSMDIPASPIPDAPQ